MADQPEEKEPGKDGNPVPEDDDNSDEPQTSKLETSGLEGSGLECPICLQSCMHPVELPCKHVFCYLCIKGVAMQGPNSKCAICRATIPSSVLTNPQLKDISQLYKEPKSVNGYLWYYESRSGGWWLYDERTMQDLERAFSSNQSTCQLLLAGHLYVVDFTQMIQYRSSNRSVSRRIKRGINLEKRGVAGIRIAGSNTGAGSSGGANNGSSPPPPQGPAQSTRRRRGNSSAAPGNSQQPTAMSGQHSQSSVPSSVNSNSGATSSGTTTNSDSGRVQDGNISDSDDESIEEDEDYDSDYSDVDDDMELGEEEEGLIGDDSDERETEDEEEYESRDGARAPTRRSDRSNSSNNQTPPPPGTAMGNGGVSRTYSPNPNNGRGSRGAKGGRSSGGRSGNSSNGAASRSASIALTDSQVVPTHHSASSNSNVLTSLFYNRCNLEDTVSKINVSNNNYVGSTIIGQVNYSMTQSLSTIGSTKITFEKHSHHLNQEEYL